MEETVAAGPGIVAGIPSPVVTGGVAGALVADFVLTVLRLGVGSSVIGVILAATVGAWFVLLRFKAILMCGRRLHT